MRKNKNTSKIILALLVAGLATIISYSAFSNMNSDLVGKEKMIQEMQQNDNQQTTADNYAYTIAKRDLKAGEMVADEDVDFKPFTQADSTAFENRSDVVNKVLLQDIPAGSTFTTDYIAKVSSDNNALKPGYRSLTLPAQNFEGKSSKMTQGSNVDVFSVSDGNNWTLENIKILSFEGASGTKGSADILSASSIDFEVPVNSIVDFISNMSKGKLVLVARNPNDKHVSRKKYHSSSGPSNLLPTYQSSIGKLPKLPASPTIGTLPGGNLTALPSPIKPAAPAQEVEMIEANVKTKVTFD